MGQAPQKAMTPEVEAQETTLSSPRFDEAAAQMARPVVPLAAESLPANSGSKTNRVTYLTPLLSKKGSWLLAAFVGLILTVGAMAIGIKSYRRNQAASAPSTVPAAEAIRVELKPDPIPVEAKPIASRPVEARPVEEKRSNTPSNAQATAIAKPKKLERRAPQQSTSDRNPGARLVDSYVIRRRP